MIRMALRDDIPQLLEWGDAFARQAEIDWYAPESFEQTLLGMIENPDAAVILHDKGMIGGIIYPHFLNSNHKIAQEVFWWAEGNGADLMRAFEFWAESSGAKEVHMSCLDHLRADALARVYRSNGYRALDRSFARSL